MAANDTYDFEHLADETLQSLLNQISDLEEDAIEADLESGVLTIGFEDGAEYVINSHRAATQIWMAAGSTAWHFSWDGSAWIASKNGDELWATTNRVLSKKLGRAVELLSNG